MKTPIEVYFLDVGMWTLSPRFSVNHQQYRYLYRIGLVDRFKVKIDTIGAKNGSILIPFSGVSMVNSKHPAAVCNKYLELYNAQA